LVISNSVNNLVRVINCKLELQSTCKKQFTLDYAVTQTPICWANIQWWFIRVQNPIEKADLLPTSVTYYTSVAIFIILQCAALLPLL